MSDKVSINGLDKAKVLAALYNGARAQGMGFLAYDPKPMGEVEAGELLKDQTYFDYLKGRVMKVDLSGDEIDPYLYDRDNGRGALASVITALRSTGDTNPEEAELLHLEGTRKAATIVQEHLGDRTSIRLEDGAIVADLGFDEFSPKLKPKIDDILGE